MGTSLWKGTNGQTYGRQLLRVTKGVRQPDEREWPHPWVDQSTCEPLLASRLARPNEGQVGAQSAGDVQGLRLIGCRAATHVYDIRC